MKKVAIIGASGAGKTTLAKKLGPVLRIKVFHMDRFFWKSNWVRKDSDTRMELLEKFVLERQWIIEGSYLSLFEARLDEADTIIFLDISPWLCLRRIIKRHFEDDGCPRRDIPEGCIDRLDMHSILRVLTFPLRDRKKLGQRLSCYESKQIIWLRSDKEVEDFLGQQEQKVGNNKGNASKKAASNRSARSLAAIG